MEPFITDFALSIGSSMLYDLLKWMKDTNQTLENQCKKILKRVIKQCLPKQYYTSSLVDGIAHEIAYYNIQGNTPFSFEQVQLIVEKNLLEYNQHNIDSRALTSKVIASLPKELFAEKKFFDFFSQQMLTKIYENSEHTIQEIKNLSRQSQNHNELEKRIDFVQRGYDALVKEQRLRENARYKGLQTTINTLFGIITQYVEYENILTEHNNFVPEFYQKYFEKELFLERHLTDGKACRLVDTYIIPDYKQLDFKEPSCINGEKNLVTFIQDFVNDNLMNRNYGTSCYSGNSKRIKVAFIKGQPGSGKTSLFYYLAYQKTHTASFLPNHKVFFIRLIELLKLNNNSLSQEKPIKDILKHIGVSRASINNAIFVLDGLDEICTVKDMDIYKYCNHLISDIYDMENCKAIITTRLNYVNISGQNVINVQLLELDLPALKKWTKMYFSIHPSLQGLIETAASNIAHLESDAQSDLVEIAAIPMLFYMISALGLDISKVSSIGSLYDSVFTELYERNYNDNDDNYVMKHSIHEEIPPILSRKIAQEVGWKMYVTDSLLLKVHSEDILMAIDKAYTSTIGSNLEPKMKDTIERLFPITFFYKEAVDVVEFAHKSIMEYFVADKLTDEILAAEDRQEIRKILSTRFLSKYITSEVLAFVQYMLSQKTVEKRTADIIMRGFTPKRGEFTNPEQFPSEFYGIEYSLIYWRLCWIFASALDRAVETPQYQQSLLDGFKFPMETIIKTSIKGRAPLADAENVTWDFHGIHLCDYSLSSSALPNFTIDTCKIARWDISYSHIRKMTCTHTEWENCQQLYSVTFEDSYFCLVDFKKCHVDRTSFSKTQFSEIDFFDSSLSEVLFEGVKLENCRLVATKLVACRFSSCTLFGLNTEGAVLQGCTFSETRFMNSNLICLEDTQFHVCQFKACYLNLADLPVHNISTTVFDNIVAIYYDAELTKVSDKLTGAELSLQLAEDLYDKLKKEKGTSTEDDSQQEQLIRAANEIQTQKRAIEKFQEQIEQHRLSAKERIDSAKKHLIKHKITFSVTNTLREIYTNRQNAKRAQVTIVHMKHPTSQEELAILEGKYIPFA